MVSYILGIVFTLFLILPSFFTLLIVRTTTTEKKSDKFGVRQEVIRAEKFLQKAVRWFRIIFRSTPMTFYILFLPYIMVYVYFPNVSGEVQNRSLIWFCCGVLVLQCLGTIRAYYSWRDRDVKVPLPPQVYKPIHNKKREEKSSNEEKDWFPNLFCCGGATRLHNHQDRREEAKQHLRSKFKLKSVGGVVLLASLTLEFFQMATFALQNDPYTEKDSSDSSSSTSESDSDFWGSDIFNAVYVTVNDNIQYTTMWCAVALVIILILLFCNQFLLELRKYGYLMRSKATKDSAKDSFFFSFTGSIVYGHGNPNNLSSNFRMLVAVLTDGLFLVISLRLLDALACDTSSDVPVLLVDPRIVCWEGKHAPLAYMSMTCYALYVPLSIMIAPMLLEKESSSATKSNSNPNNDDNTESYVQLYVMVINVIKSVLLLIASLGPRTVTALVISTTISSLLMGLLTVFWFHYTDLQRFVDVQPASIPFINVFKSSSYFASVVTAVIVIAAHNVGKDAFTSTDLAIVLPIAWTGVILACAFYFNTWKAGRGEYLAREEQLIKFPFKCRISLEEAACSLSSWPEADGRVLGDYRKSMIPSFQVSAWHDDVCSEEIRTTSELTSISIFGLIKKYGNLEPLTTAVLPGRNSADDWDWGARQYWGHSKYKQKQTTHGFGVKSSCGRKLK